MATLFSSLEKGLLVFPHIAEIDWQMRSRFLHYIGHQNGNSTSRMVKFGMEHPKTQENKMQLSPGPSSKGKARGIEYVPVMFYCGDCKYCTDKITNALRSTKKNINKNLRQKGSVFIC
jgi:hypothetical protein